VGRGDRIAANEARFREINERLRADLRAAGVGLDDAIAFVCECGHHDCHATVAMTVAEYEQVRANGRRFALLAGHAMPGVERVVERHDRYEVAEKIAGIDVVEASDPRKDDAAD
jgi:hypothetical protein